MLDEAQHVFFRCYCRLAADPLPERTASRHVADVAGDLVWVFEAQPDVGEPDLIEAAQVRCYLVLAGSEQPDER